MPYTKRKAHHGTLDDLLDYIMNEEKTDGGTLVTGQHCNPDFAKKDFTNVMEDYSTKGINKGTRVGYHIIQSFSPNDKITPQQAHEIGTRLCNELYPNYQAVISTHIDRGHIHNHIALNSVNLDGKKLNDKRNDKKEGLYAISKKSDEIASDYGCFILPEMKFKYDKNKKSEMYYNYRHTTWRQTILDEMKELKIECNSINEFIVKLFDKGYDIKYGKYISVKPQGKERFVRLKTLSEEFSEENLRLYFTGVKPEYYYHFKKYTETDFNQKYVEYYNELQIALELTSTIAIKGGKLPQFQKTRKKTEVQLEKVQQVLDLLQSNNINSYDDLEEKIKMCRNKIYSANKNIKKYEKENSRAVETIDKAQTFLMLLKEYECAMYYKEIDVNYKLPAEIQMFNDLKEELRIETEQEGKDLIKSLGEVRKNINGMKSSLYDLQQDLYGYDLLKEKQLLKSDMFIHNIKVGNNRIDYSKSTNTEWCINLPYCDYYIMISKNLTTYNHKYGYNTLFLIDDKSYQLYKKGENNELQRAERLSGNQLDRYVAEIKAKNTENHQQQKEK